MTKEKRLEYFCYGCGKMFHYKNGIDVLNNRVHKKLFEDGVNCKICGMIYEIEVNLLWLRDMIVWLKLVIERGIKYY